MAFWTGANHRGAPPPSYAVMPFILCKNPTCVLSPDSLDALSAITPVVLGAGTGHASRLPYSACSCESMGSLHPQYKAQQWLLQEYYLLKHSVFHRVPSRITNCTRPSTKSSILCNGFLYVFEHFNFFLQCCFLQNSADKLSQRMEL